MRAVWNFATSLGGSALLGSVALGLTLGLVLDDLRNVLIAIAMLAVVAISIAVLTRANEKHHQINREELDPDPFNERLTWVAPVRAYDCTATTPGRPERNWRNLTTGDLAALLHRLDVPSYEADGDRGDTTVNGTRITWQPSTHTTGDNR